ncbi:unnamed protein product [Owenia fusiformis]|uniref:Semaphorin-2A n=1 Tax=Owenia fusiformis TaxID=6347 RepID=A0A8S4MZP4_OWEFU|nr:unnamed protein product [Owenia fusiformis]
MYKNGAALFVLHGLSCLLGFLHGSKDDTHSSVNGPKDFRIVTFDDFRKSLKEGSVQTYHSRDVTDIAQLTLDIPNNQLLVGARNYLLRLAIDDLSQLEKVEWPISDTEREMCLKKRPGSTGCENFVKVLLTNNEGGVFACGTNAFEPKCSWREATNLGTVRGWVKGLGKCPFSLQQNSTAFISQDGNLFSGTVIDSAGGNSLIHRIWPSPPPGLSESAGISSLGTLRTERDSKWLNGANFVSSYEIGDFVYFFFRETAVEYINCGKNVYSRVARMCKNDPGGQFLMKDRWTSFTKARLNCSLPGEYPFYYNELQHTYYNESEGLIYATFSTSTNSIAGSAVCVYNMTSLNNAFSSDFKHQEHSQAAWQKFSNPSPMYQCAGSPSVLSAGRAMRQQAPRMINSQKYLMMDKAVQPTSIMPMYSSEHERWSHIAVDTVPAKHHRSFTVMFLVDQKGQMKKIVHLKDSKTSCLVEEITIMSKDKTQPIKSMHLHKAGHESHIIIATDSKLLKIPTQRCGRFLTKTECMNAQDPYCGWHDPAGRCTTPPRGNIHTHNWHQDVKSCPIMDAPVDGKWEMWSNWTRCSHISDPNSPDMCRCRYRACEGPFNGGRPCSGSIVEVTNCTVHGAWTKWSDWSSCSSTCGSSERTRRRECGNPKPKYGGRLCVGSDLDVQDCRKAACPPPTPPPIDGGWSDWSDWGRCSAKCGGGIRTRNRECNSPRPQNDGKPCAGNLDDWQMCNQHECNEVRKPTQWTPWLRSNITNDGYFEQRHRYICRARVSDPSDLRASNPKTEIRFCDPKGVDCDNKGASRLDTDGGWTKWTSWNQCSAPCNGGVQWRSRECTDPEPSGSGKDCDGHSMEKRECNTHSCNAEWSCWSDYSACSVSCGIGTKKRTRVCDKIKDGRVYTRGCDGDSEQELECEMAACDVNDGWGKWTLWSVCSPKNLQKRVRKCLPPFPTRTQCKGEDEEIRPCEYNVIDVNVASVSSGSKGEKTGFELLHVIIVGVIAFILGAVIAIGIFLFCQRRRQQKYNIQQDSLKHLEKNKSHLYMMPSDSGVNLNNSSNMNIYTNLNQMNMNSINMNGTLTKGDKMSQMTVKEATIKRNSLMRTNLSINDL